MEQLHVRELITQLSYSQLVLMGVIPDLGKVTPKVASKRYPPWVYSLGDPNIFSDLGLFVEEVIYAATINDRTSYPDLWSRVCRSQPPSQLNSSGAFFGSIATVFKQKLAGHEIEHGKKFTHQQIEGHPDLTCLNFGGQTWILDIKTTAGFSKMAEQSYLQILAYSALARANNLVNNYIGILLSLQKQIVWYDVSHWDHRYFLNLLVRESEWRREDLLMLSQDYLLTHLEEGAILSPTLLNTIGRRIHSTISGAHVSKDKLIEYARESAGRPLQVFLGNPRARGNVSMKDISKFCQEIPAGTSIFVHAPYIINLAADQSDPWAIERLSSELMATRQFKGKGVVVHVGNHKETNVSEALTRMERSIQKVLEASSPETPLLLETPAGEGTELCSSIEQLMEFYQRFKGSPNFKICIDFCHIFAAGYDPVWYLTQWLEKFPGSIALVHFNDSKVPRGSRVDLHYFPGLGFIGYKRMWECHQLCVKHGIPMVRE